MTKKEMLRAIKKAANDRFKAENGSRRQGLSIFCCLSLGAPNSPLRREFEELFCPEYAKEAVQKGRYLCWTFFDSNCGTEGEDSVTPGLRDLAMCLFYEIVKNGDY